MIRVQKSAAAPASLVRQAGAARATLEQAYEDDPAGCRRPATAALKPVRTIYAAPDVKAKLKQDQHNKCAYCETRFVHSSPGDVEHFRPKAGYRQTAKGRVQGPGYYWLAYEWSNLLFACEDCNRTHKRQLFPLRNHATGRAHCHRDDVAREDPLLLNPANGPDPELHITFVEEAAQGLTPEGKASVEAYGLNRRELLDDRRDRLRCLQNIEFLARLFEIDPPVVDLERLVVQYGSAEALSAKVVQARLDYQRASLDSAEYAGMVRANFPHLPQR